VELFLSNQKGFVTNTKLMDVNIVGYTSETDESGKQFTVILKNLKK
jgi:hypothetical protein